MLVELMGVGGSSDNRPPVARRLTEAERLPSACHAPPNRFAPSSLRITTGLARPVSLSRIRGGHDADAHQVEESRTDVLEIHGIPSGVVMPPCVVGGSVSKRKGPPSIVRMAMVYRAEVPGNAAVTSRWTSATPPRARFIGLE